jgi:hypothetical protein
MDKHTLYLIDDIIRFAQDQKMDLSTATDHLLDLARQRLPEYEIELATLRKSHEVFKSIQDSSKHYLIIRVIMKTWVHEVIWTYYPDFHVIDYPYSRRAFPIVGSDWVKEPCKPDNVTYIDDLFYDLDEIKFWQPEPFLSSKPASQNLYQHISSKPPKLPETPYRKIRPDLVKTVIELEQSNMNYSIQPYPDDLELFRRNIGAKGYQNRMKELNPHRIPNKYC